MTFNRIQHLSTRKESDEFCQQSSGGLALRRLQRLEQIRVPAREVAVRQVGDQAEAEPEGRMQGAASVQAEAGNQDSERRSCRQVQFFQAEWTSICHARLQTVFLVADWIRGRRTSSPLLGRRTATSTITTSGTRQRNRCTSLCTRARPDRRRSESTSATSVSGTVPKRFDALFPFVGLVNPPFISTYNPLSLQFARGQDQYVQGVR